MIKIENPAEGGDVPARLGLTYAQLAGVNEAVVCCSLSGFGMTGRRRAQPCQATWAMSAGRVAGTGGRGPGGTNSCAGSGRGRRLRAR
ncbi:MAG: CoA transferase [Actinoplanes sp.]